MRRFFLSSFFAPPPPPRKKVANRRRRLFFEPLEGRRVLAGQIAIADGGGTELTAPTGFTEIPFEITYSGDAVPGGFTVDWSIDLSGTADDADFPDQYMSGTVQFDGCPGMETKSAMIKVHPDRIVELAESFYVDLGAVTAPDTTVTDGRALGTIGNDDSAKILIHMAPAGGQFVEDHVVDAPEGNSPTTTVYNVKFWLTSPVDTAVSFDYDFIDSLATQGIDYTVSSDNGTITFPAGQEGYGLVPTVLTVTFVGDDIVERDEWFDLMLDNLQVSGRDVTFNSGEPTEGDFAHFQIFNDDTATVTITVQGLAMKAEGNDFTFDVRVDKAVDTSFTVQMTTGGGTASAADDDYELNNVDIVFAGNAGETHPYTIQVNDDQKVELNETLDAHFSIIQTSGRAVVGGPPTATGTIVNNDQAKVSISGSGLLGGPWEGNVGETPPLPYTVTLSQIVDADVIVSLIAWGVTATGMPGPEQDFIEPGQAAVTIPAGQLSATFNVTIVGDARVESNETIEAALVNATASGRDVIIDDANDQDTGTIWNDD